MRVTLQRLDATASICIKNITAQHLRKHAQDVAACLQEVAKVNVDRGIIARQPNKRETCSIMTTVCVPHEIRYRKVKC